MPELDELVALVDPVALLELVPLVDLLELLVPELVTDELLVEPPAPPEPVSSPQPATQSAITKPKLTCFVVIFRDLQPGTHQTSCRSATAAEYEKS
jgi:hypothetical protein